nr:Dual specificity tyrosine-phosphorylation-regulated kinase 1A [Polyrhizophydium stewartii]
MDVLDDEKHHNAIANHPKPAQAQAPPPNQVQEQPQPQQQPGQARGGWLAPVFKLTVNISEIYAKIKTHNDKESKRKRSDSTEPPASDAETTAATVATTSSKRPATETTKRNKLNNYGYDDENDDYIVRPGEVWNNRFEIHKALGKGSFGLVVQAYDRESSEQVAIKIIKNRRSFYNQGQVEIRLLQLISGRDQDESNCVVHMKEHFMHRNHLCIVYELLHMNLYEILKRNRFTGLPLFLVRQFCSQLLCGLRFLSQSDMQIIHCDLKPENIMLRIADGPQIKIIDFGSSCFNKQTTYTYIQSRFYRSPEVIMGHPYTTAIDMWSLGCVLVELLTGEPLFPGKDEHDQMVRICEVLGLPPQDFLDRTPPDRLSRIFVRRGQGVGSGAGASSSTWGMALVPGKRASCGLSDTDTADASYTDQIRFIDLVERMLRFEPDQRIKPDEALEHPFFQAMINRAVSTDLVCVDNNSQNNNNQNNKNNNEMGSDATGGADSRGSA